MVAVMGVGNRAGDLWTRERRAWVDHPWMWKLFVLVSLAPLVSAATRAGSNPWFAAVSLLLAIICLTLAVLSYRAVKRALALGDGRD